MLTEHCNRVLVERYFLGEGGAGEKRSVRLHLDGCAECRGLVSSLEKERRDYLLAHPYREFAAKHPPEGNAVRKSSSSPRWLPAVAGLAACLVLMPVVLRYGMRGPVVAESGVRTKGGLVLEYYLKRGGSVTPGDASEAHRAGDELQFVYSAGGHAYVTLASIDARGHVSLYRSSGSAPAGADSPPLSLPAAPGEKQALPFAVTLDDSPGSELFVMIFGSGPLTGGEVESWLTGAFTRASGNLEGLVSLLPAPPGPAGAKVKTLLLRKSQA
ncbi:MAG TPA: hypothetical protein VJ385_14095 [Fibrobacteria bacterium]|nr:hypothetical protein [Fibrobacteria bacterium]